MRHEGGSILPALFIVLPRFYGSPLTQVFNITQHAGLAEDVLDHRLNTRTVIFNPLFDYHPTVVASACNSSALTWRSSPSHW